MGPLPFKDLPAALNVAAETALTVTEYGEHVINLGVQVENDPELTDETNLYVVKQPASQIGAS